MSLSSPVVPTTPFEILKDKISMTQYDTNKYYIGRILTIIDAAIADKEQRKGIKDLIHQAYCTEVYYNEQIWEMLNQFIEQYCPGLEPEKKKGNPRIDYPSPPDYFKDCEITATCKS